MNKDEKIDDDLIEKRIEGSDGKQESLLEDSNKENKRYENQLRWAIYLMVGIILIIVLITFVNNNFINKFEYHEITFQKTQLGDLIFYSAKFPVVSTTGQVTGDYAINLRNDPRSLDYIPVNVNEGDIKFSLIMKNDTKIYAPTYISINPFMKICDDSGISLLTLSGFLRDSGLNVRSAVTDKAYAKANNETHKWCDPLSTVIIITDGNKSVINEIQPSCFELKFKDCEVLKVSEKFVLNILEQYGDRFKK
ncbi:MAG: hypothetical protein AABW83_00935 [Nanoarchaeota archaeon]